MKQLKLLTGLLCASITFFACQPEEKPSIESNLSLSELSVASEIKVPGTLEFSCLVADESVALSTLEVSAALSDGSILASKSIRTAGNEVKVEDSIDIPFGPNMASGSEIILSFEAINVNGDTKKEIKKVSVIRPQLPETLYMTIGESLIQLNQSLEDANLYVTEDGEYDSITSAVISTSAELSEAAFVWGTSEEDNIAQLCSFSDANGISISYPTYVVSSYTFNALSFRVGVNGVELNVSVNGTALQAQSGLLYANVNFTKDAEVEISGIEDIDQAWNRDFFEKKDNGKFTFLRESGAYDVYYSPRYNYIWILKNAAVAPECLWIIGHGFTSAYEWHEDYSTGGWETEPVTRLAYAVKIDDNKYQASLYLNDQHEWGSFEFEVYSDLESSKDNGFGGTSLSGFTKGIRLSGAKDGKPGLTSDNGFQPGYYTITFDNASGDINLNRISDWVDNGKSGIFFNGTELEVTETYNYANVYFESGSSVSVSGIELSHLNRDFFTVEGESVTFNGTSGTYLVQYYPDYQYTWLSNEEMTFPDCLYILGAGKWAAPVFDTRASWDIDGWTRSAPMMVVAPKVAENTYKATMSMSTDNQNWRVQCELYSDLSWGQSGVTPQSLSGDAAARFYLDGNCINGVDEKEDPFVPGNYEFTFTVVDGGLAVSVKKID